jgi:hypothetical protein
MNEEICQPTQIIRGTAYLLALLVCTELLLFNTPSPVPSVTNLIE